MAAQPPHVREADEVGLSAEEGAAEGAGEEAGVELGRKHALYRQVHPDVVFPLGFEEGKLKVDRVTRNDSQGVCHGLR